VLGSRADAGDVSRERSHDRRRLVTSVVAVTMVAGLLLPSAPASASSRCVRWGALVPSAPGEAGNLDALERSVGRTVDYFGYYQGWASRDAFDFGRAEAAFGRGAVPVVAWEPWDWLKGSEQPEFALSRIIAGDFDEYIRGWAADARRFGRRVLLRFAYEMNGDWMPWSEGVNGNKPGQYVQAWRHVHRIFRQEGATNVRWVWAPNVISPDFVPLQRLYPGDRYVDLVGIDGYNWGTTQPSWGSRWQSFDEIFRPTIRRIRRITSKRILITETASTEHGGNKARWIRETLAAFDRYPSIVGFMWFNYDKETDWRIQSSPEALRAFRKGIRHHRFNCDQRLKTNRRVVRRGEHVKLIARVRPRIESRERVFLYRGAKRIRSKRTGSGPTRLAFRVRPRQTARFTIRVRGLPAHDLGPSRSNPVRIRVR
jgi:hypothetical protein